MTGAMRQVMTAALDVAASIFLDDTDGRDVTALRRDFARLTEASLGAELERRTA